MRIKTQVVPHLNIKQLCASLFMSTAGKLKKRSLTEENKTKQK